MNQLDIRNIFKAALVPGILLIVGLSLYAFCHQFINAKGNKKQENRFADLSWDRVKQTFWEGIWDWPIIAIIILGVYGGY